MQLSGLGTGSPISERLCCSLAYAWSKFRGWPSCICCSANKGERRALTSSRRVSSFSNFSSKNSSTSSSEALSLNFMRDVGGTLSSAHKSEMRAATAR